MAHSNLVFNTKKCIFWIQFPNRINDYCTALSDTKLAMSGHCNTFHISCKDRTEYLNAQRIWEMEDI